MRCFSSLPLARVAMAAAITVLVVFRGDSPAVERPKINTISATGSPRHKAMLKFAI